MPNHKSGAIRNFSLIGGPGTGKTSLAEAVLHKAGAISRLGSVGEGTTVSDFEHEEKEKQHSVALGVLHADHDGHRLNILDAPGYPDFIGEAATALAAAETAVLCVKAGEGVTFPSHRVWGLAGKRGRARAVVVTGIDHADFDWAATVTEIGEALGSRCLPVAIPDGSGPNLGGVSLVPMGEGAEGAASSAREALLEAVVEADEEAMMRFLEEDKTPDEAEATKLLTRSMLSGDVVPVLAVSSLDGKGIEEFLAFAIRCFPSPEDGPFYTDIDGNVVMPDAPGASALVFKTYSDPFVGKLCMARVVSGSITSGQSLQLQRTEKSEKIPALQLRQGKEQSAVEGAVAGDIVAIPKVEVLETSDTLCDAAHAVTFPPVAVPKPMVARAIHPKDHKDDAKLSDALKKAANEDATFIFDRDEATGQLLVHGVSMMHLETCLKRINERSHVEVEVELPKVPFRETITIKADGHHRHKKQTGGRGQFGEVYLSVEPAERGTGLDFQDATVGGSVPRQFIPAIEKGIREIMATGVIAGCIVVDVTVKVTDGKFHNVDSDEASFKLAGARAFKDAFLKAKPVLLEPLFDMEIATPSSHMGAITSDITGRRGQILGMDSIGDTQIVRARVPQKEVLTYPTALQALTQGEGSFTAEYHDYELVPSNVQQEIMSEFKPEADED